MKEHHIFLFFSELYMYGETMNSFFCRRRECLIFKCNGQIIVFFLFFCLYYCMFSLTYNSDCCCLFFYEFFLCVGLVFICSLSLVDYIIFCIYFFVVIVADLVRDSKGMVVKIMVIWS